jgi:hypothetical protein
MGKSKEGNYKERMLIWKEKLLNDKAQNEENIRSNNTTIELLQESNRLQQRSIDLNNEELEFAEKELSE